MNKKSKSFCTILINKRNDEIVCTPLWPNIKVDWIGTYSISLRKSDRLLAERYKRAVEDGKIYTNPRIVKTRPHNPKDPQKTYVKSDGFVMAKYLNSDLKKLGY